MAGPVAVESAAAASAVVVGLRGFAAEVRVAVVGRAFVGAAAVGAGRAAVVGGSLEVAVENLVAVSTLGQMCLEAVVDRIYHL